MSAHDDRPRPTQAPAPWGPEHAGAFLRLAGAISGAVDDQRATDPALTWDAVAGDLALLLAAVHREARGHPAAEAGASDLLRHIEATIRAARRADPALSPLDVIYAIAHCTHEAHRVAWEVRHDVGNT